MINTRSPGFGLCQARRCSDGKHVPLQLKPVEQTGTFDLATGKPVMATPCTTFDIAGLVKVRLCKHCGLAYWEAAEKTDADTAATR